MTMGNDLLLLPHTSSLTAPTAAALVITSAPLAQIVSAVLLQSLFLFDQGKCRARVSQAHSALISRAAYKLNLLPCKWPKCADGKTQGGALLAKRSCTASLQGSAVNRTWPRAVCSGTSLVTRFFKR